MSQNKVQNDGIYIIFQPKYFIFKMQSGAMP